MSDDSNIDIRVSPSLHPDLVKNIDGYDDGDIHNLLAPVETAFSAAYIGVGAVHDARVLAEKNPAWTEENRLMQMDNLASKKLGNITQTFDSVRTNLDKTIAHLETSLLQPVTEKAAQSVSAEIRAHLKGLDTGERMTVIRQAIQGGDDRVATAALGAPALLVGLDPKMQEVLLREYHAHRSPGTVIVARLIAAAPVLVPKLNKILTGGAK
jgi:hypothetical protein